MATENCAMVYWIFSNIVVFRKSWLKLVTLMFHEKILLNYLQVNILNFVYKKLFFKIYFCMYRVVNFMVVQGNGSPV